MRSLHARLTIILLLLTLLSLGLTGVGIEHAMRRELEAGLDHRLLLLAQGIGSAVGVAIDGAVKFELDDPDMREIRQSASTAFYAVADETGSALFRSDSFPPELLRTTAPSPTYLSAFFSGRTMRICLLPVRRQSEGDEEDRELWLTAHPGLELPGPRERRLLVATGLPEEDLRRTLALLRQRLIYGFAFLSLLLTAVPLLGIGLSLKPLRRISREAEGLGPGNPGARLTATGVDREILPLVVALNNALDRIVEAYEDQKRFTADAAHELRTPLSAIRTQCEVSLRKARGVEELEETLTSIHRTTLRLCLIVESLLSLARLSESGAKLSMKPLDLGVSVREAVRLLTPAAEARRITIRVELEPDIRMTGSEKLLTECVSNLLDNAVRYTDGGGAVVIQGGAAPSPWITIADNGIGIPENHLGRIFERFYQADPSRSGRDGTSGLGLAIAQEIARLHEGSITVESSPGAGSLFTLRFEEPPDAGGTG